MLKISALRDIGKSVLMHWGYVDYSGGHILDIEDQKKLLQWFVDNKPELFEEIIPCHNSDRDDVLAELLYRKREEADWRYDGVCPYKRCVLSEIEDELHVNEV